MNHVDIVSVFGEIGASKEPSIPVRCTYIDQHGATSYSLTKKKMKFSLRLLTTYLVGFSKFTQATGSASPDSDPNVLVEALKGGSAAGVEEFKFETEVNKVMDIIIHSLYKTKGTMNHTAAG